ncbi:hypothetical protein N288_10170 [Bacillus infantis NRRL B-14911]|uniref:Uncharacterized protein n=1 Tax=Bacillus infantis NRRL B-14911 TaxID=1367477 RepID=U5LB53_9BACI|nr:hypothetical protein N288_10170 [Bacillus infantis NRRL B-14911]
MAYETALSAYLLLADTADGKLKSSNRDRKIRGDFTANRRLERVFE